VAVGNRSAQRFFRFTVTPSRNLSSAHWIVLASSGKSQRRRLKRCP
jgi:hypothetical protein